MIEGAVPTERILAEPEASNTLENILFSAPLIAGRLGWSCIRVWLCKIMSK
jgi:uncharacterized SAM-binding protein YcdF (DUF218 family)